MKTKSRFVLTAVRILLLFSSFSSTVEKHGTKARNRSGPLTSDCLVSRTEQNEPPFFPHHPVSGSVLCKYKADKSLTHLLVN